MPSCAHTKKNSVANARRDHARQRKCARVPCCVRSGTVDRSWRECASVRREQYVVLQLCILLVKILYVEGNERALRAFRIFINYQSSTELYIML